MIVPNQQSKSEGFNCGPWRPAALITPAALEATSAKFLFEVSLDGTTWYPLYTDAGARTIGLGLTTNEARAITLDRNEMFPWTWIKIQIVAADGTTAVVQTVNRTFTLIFDYVI